MTEHEPRNRIVQATLNADGTVADEDYEYVSEAARIADEERIAFVRSELAAQDRVETATAEIRETAARPRARRR